MIGGSLRFTRYHFPFDGRLLIILDFFVFYFCYLTCLNVFLLLNMIGGSTGIIGERVTGLNSSVVV